MRWRSRVGKQTRFGWAAIAQLVERHLGKVEVSGSNPDGGSKSFVRRHTVSPKREQQHDDAESLVASVEIMRPRNASHKWRMP